MPHNIDLHGVTGPGGGAASSFTAPGHRIAVHVQGAQPGPVRLSLRHRAGGHARGQWHVRPDPGRAAGGPAAGGSRVLRDAGRLLHRGQVPRERAAALRHAEGDRRERRPTCCSTARSRALTGENALKAKTGENVRLFVGNGGPNLVSSFHVIGEIFDKVQYEGGTRFQENVQTTLIPAGGAAIVEFHIEVPGNYVLVDHSIFRAFNKGALAILEGRAANEAGDLLRQAGRRGVPRRQARPNLAPVAAAAQASASGTLTTRAAGEGRRGAVQGHLLRLPPGQRARAFPSVFPPLAKSDYLLADRKRAIGVVLNGLTGPVTVNGNDLQLGDAADEPAERRRGREHPHLRRSTAGATTAARSPRAQVKAVRASTKRTEGAAH